MPYFQTAAALPKEAFLAAYKDCILLSQLLFAPFGVDEGCILSVYGEGSGDILCCFSAVRGRRVEATVQAEGVRG